MDSHNQANYFLRVFFSQIGHCVERLPPHTEQIKPHLSHIPAPGHELSRVSPHFLHFILDMISSLFRILNCPEDSPHLPHNHLCLGLALLDRMLFAVGLGRNGAIQIEGDFVQINHPDTVCVGTSVEPFQQVIGKEAMPYGVVFPAHLTGATGGKKIRPLP